MRRSDDDRVSPQPKAADVSGGGSESSISRMPRHRAQKAAGQSVEKGCWAVADSVAAFAFPRLTGMTETVRRPA
jgi:hypothetical protein